MGKVKLENVDKDLKQELKNPEFRKHFQIERVKVALAQKIAELREDLGLNQSALAKRMHVSQQFISQIETGERNNLTIETLEKIAMATHTKLNIDFQSSHS